MRSLRVSLWFLLALVPAAARAADPNEELIVAARKNDLATVKALLDKGANVNAKNRYGATALSYACDRGNLEIVKLLIERGADVNVKDTFYGARPLDWAASKNHVAVVMLLLDKGAESPELAMRAAINEGHTELARAVLGRGGFKPEALRNFLQMAEKNNRQEIAEMLRQALLAAGEDKKEGQ